jgi:hypothetical protein
MTARLCQGCRPEAKMGHCQPQLRVEWREALCLPRVKSIPVNSQPRRLVRYSSRATLSRGRLAPAFPYLKKCGARPCHFVLKLSISWSVQCRRRIKGIMQCYYPNGESDDGLHPCNATAAVSHCCRASDVCITNGFCFSSGLNAVVRRGCTDKTFNSTECPQQCTIGRQFLR